MVKQINRLKRNVPTEAPTPTPVVESQEVQLLREIREQLKE